MTESSEARISKSVTEALQRAGRFDEPYRHWAIEGLFPEDVVADLQAVAFPVADLEGVSGKREYHNDTRRYFDQANIERLPVFAAIANVFQSPGMAREIERFFGADVDGTYLRIEYAQDVDGFWLEPHTDLGVKRLTALVYLSEGPEQDTLGTDVYDGDKRWAKRMPFASNSAMAFVPSGNTYHGFEKRPINGVRKSLILNYVTDEWRDREQLAFPHKTVSVA